MSTVHHFIRADNSIVEVCSTDVSDGDFHVDADPELLRDRRAAIMPGAWAVVRQVHGTDLVVADPAMVPDADALTTSTLGQPIAVQGADCAPLAFITDQGPIAVAHAGWRGLHAGIIERVSARLATFGAAIECIVVGPVIGPECYEFGAEDLDAVASVLGNDVRSTTGDGGTALDLRAAITAASAAVDVMDVRFVGGCTACGGAGFSHRARKDTERHAVVARILPTSSETT